MSLEEATRQLQSALHDAQVAFDCVGLGDLENAHTHVLTARVAVDSAETTLRTALERMSPDEAEREGEKAVAALEEQI
ncbi:hypothetical protein [Actinocorallia longicatena]|uniref:Uncharacterized protein n=1 Tax=Actinocorallia longicatena TaxID=111803 RepID=A0ABP6Q2N9_9ACTN